MIETSRLPLCDLVMKGGVTSGVVYPRLVGRLAQSYRFQNIGGTSAGAIAAAACAAAELGRQSGRNPNAFARLGELPDYLGHALDGRSRLLWLFQPAPALQRHFELILACVALAKPAAIAGHLVGALVGPLRWTLLALVQLVTVTLLATGQTLVASLATVALAVGAAVVTAAAAALLLRPLRAPRPARLGACAFLAVLVSALLLFWRLPAAPALLLLMLYPACIMLSFAVLLGSALWRFGSTLLHGLQHNFHGLCSGRTTSAQAPQAGLTDWLAPYLNQLAGMDGSRPLVFGDLWGSAAGADGPRQINLEVISTALSQHTPYAIPFRTGAGAFYFDPLEWSELFPPDVIDWLQAHAVPDENSAQDARFSGRKLLRLPANQDLPVIVAVRMSLSFPLLMSAVPMYAKDYTDHAPAMPAPMKRVWFSDGGISSNLPLHFFDELLPEHPTFAINLKQEHPRHPIDDRAPCASNGRVYLPQDNRAGRARYWHAPAEGYPAGLVGFLGNILTTMRTWRDEILFPYPGYRDRIVQLSLRPGEGGLYLAMSQERIRALGAAGECAGELLYRRFHPAAGDGWANHQRVQVLSVLGNLERLALQAYKVRAGGDWQRAIGHWRSRRYNAKKAALAMRLLEDLEAMGAEIAASGVRLESAMMRPRPVMKLTPRI